jgi:hypothetical protein
VLRSTENYETSEPQHFTYLSMQVASWLKTLSARTTIAYVEAEYFGGVGDQCAVAWQDGIEVSPPTKAKDAIDRALRLLVQRHNSILGWPKLETVVFSAVRSNLRSHFLVVTLH